MKNDAARWAKVRETFEAALQLDAAARAEFVVTSCKNDLTLQREVEALLKASTDEDFLSEPRASLAVRTLEDAAQLGHVGIQVGPYKLVKRIGQGGMGDVYAADRADGAFAQRVAVKLVKAAFPTEELLRRFTRERHILAALNHPNIAHLLDGGVSDAGPYLAMEFVDGKPLLEHCDARRLVTQERLELLATVCDAVHFAHEELVVHRDLKPSNVLVTDEGRVKLLDFGIAGLVEEGGSSAEPLTQTGFRRMTPEYASPEQARGESASAASDIYSLGILVYELLTGQRPYDLTGLSPAAVERRIADEPPTRPSDAVLRRGVAPTTGEPTDPDRVGHARSTRPDRLHRILRGDLDTIVLKAMHRDPDRRYDSAAALAADIRRHLAHRPVLARPDTWVYRLSTVVRRQRTLVVAAGLLLLSVLLGSLATGYQARRAETRLEDTRQLANSMLLGLNEALEDLPGSTSVRVKLMSQVLTHLDELSRDRRADPELLLEVADAYAQIGTIQGNPYYTNLGDLAATRRSYETALGIRQEVLDQNPTNDDARQALGDSYGRLAVIASSEGNLVESTRLARLALKILEPLEDFRGRDLEFVKDAARIQSVLGGNLVFAGDFDDGLAELEPAIARMEGAALQDPGDLELQLDLWQAYSNQLDGLRFSSRFKPAADLLEQRACPLLERLRESHPTRASVLYGFLECLDYMGMMQEQLLSLTEAETSYRRGLAAAESLVALDPANERGYEAVGIASVSIGRLMFRVGRPAEGRQALERALEIRQLARESNPTNERWVHAVANVARELCRGLVNAGDPDGAMEFCKQAVRTHEVYVANGNAGAIAEVTLAFALGWSARAHRNIATDADDVEERRGLVEAAIDHYERSLAAYVRAGDFGEDPAWEIDPKDIAAELDALQNRGRPVAD